MAVIRSRAALSLQHESLTAAHVSEVLGVEPSESFEIGDTFARGTRVREHSHWALDSPAGGDLEMQLRALLNRVEPLHLALRDLHDEGYRLTWACFVENHDGDGAFTLSAELVNDLGTFPADLWIDAYADTEQPA
jgi:hypothetical protein